jgi:hypothetical protein
MADGRYYDRGDSKNNVLSDAEVMRWHERKIKEQQDLSDEARDALELLRNGNPKPLFNLLIIAKPLGARNRFLMALSSSGSWPTDIADLTPCPHDPRRRSQHRGPCAMLSRALTCTRQAPWPSYSTWTPRRFNCAPHRFKIEMPPGRGILRT